MTTLGIGRRRTLRRRLAVAFILTAGIAAGALAVGTTFVVTAYRFHSFRDRAYIDAERALRTVDDHAAEPPEHITGGPEILLVRAHGSVATSPDLGLANVPTVLRQAVSGQPGAMTDRTTRVRGRSFTVVGTSTPSTEEAYFFFSREDLERSVREFRLGVAVGWVLVVLIAAAVGTAFARRVLRPVGDAADAASAVAARYLDVTPGGDGDEFTRWAGSFDSLASALEEKVTALAEARDRERRFNADIAHDLRTPLGSVLTAATLLEQHLDQVPESLHRSIGLVVEGARRLRIVADHLLELHRLEAGVETADLDEVDVGAVVHAAVRGNGWGDVVTVDSDPGVVAVADPQRVDRVIVNLLANAIKHGGGRARVSIHNGASHVSTTVADDGDGIPPEVLPHLFDRYFKASASAKDGATGAGLGLAIAWEQTRLIGGHLRVESTPGRGAQFTLLLPRGTPSTAPRLE